MKSKQNKLATLGLFTALAAILGYVETLLPVFVGIPGVKLGLANLAVLFILKRYTWREAALVSVIRILIVGFLFGSMFSILYSLAGAALSLLIMTFTIKKTDCSTVMTSIIGGVSHNVGQLIIAMMIVESTSLIYYGPALLVAGVVTGLLIGIVTDEILKRVR